MYEDEPDWAFVFWLLGNHVPLSIFALLILQDTVDSNMDITSLSYYTKLPITFYHLANNESFCCRLKWIQKNDSIGLKQTKLKKRFFRSD